MSDRVVIVVEVTNSLGLHARPAMAFVDAVQPFKVDVKVSKDDMTVDGRSIMEMMMLAAVQGSSLEIAFEGDDAANAARVIKSLFEDNFGEE